MPAFRGPCRGAGRVLGPGIGPTELQACLPAVLVEPGLAQRRPSVIHCSVTHVTVLRYQRVEINKTDSKR